MATSIGSLAVVLSTNSAAFVAGLKRAERHVATFKSSVETTLADTTKGLGNLATAAAGVGTVFAGLAGGWGLKVAAENEQAQMSFEVLLGSASEGQKVFADLQKFAVETAFDLQSASQAATQLFNAGAKSNELLPLLRIIGDQAAASSQGLNEGTKQITKALADIRAKGKLSAQELNQLSEAGVGGRGMLAEKLGITVQEVMRIAETTGIDAGVAIQAILEGMQKKTFGLMDRQAKTLRGRWDSLKETAAQTLGTVADELVRAFNIKGGLAGLTDWLQSARENARAIAESIVGFVKPLFEIARTLADVFASLFADVAAKAGPVLASVFEGGKASAASWRDMTIGAFQAVLGTAATTADMIAAIFKAVGVGFLHAKAAWLEGMAEVAYAASPALGKALQAAADAATAEARRSQKEFNREIEATSRGLGAYGRMVDDFIAKQRRRRGPGLAGDMLDTLKGSLGASAQNQKVDPNSLPFAARDVKSLADSVNGLSRAWVEAAKNARQVAENLRKEGESVASDTNPIFKLNAEIKRLNGLLNQNAITFDEYLASLGKAGESLIQAADLPDPKSPAAMMRGSQEAYSLLVQRDLKGTAQDRMAAAMERVKELMSQQERNGERMLEELRRLNLPAVVQQFN